MFFGSKYTAEFSAGVFTSTAGKEGAALGNEKAPCNDKRDPNQHRYPARTKQWNRERRIPKHR
jgi:hypothetical protein